MKKDEVLQLRPEYREARKSEPQEQEYLFTNLQTPGAILKFNFGPTNRIESYLFIPGKTYKLRREIYDHVMSRGEKLIDWRPDGTGKMRAQHINTQPYFQLQPVNH